MIDHPAGKHVGVGRSAIWYGNEVEGFLAKTPRATAFVDRVPESPEDLIDLQSRLRWGEVKHVFVTESFDAWDWFATQVLEHCGPHVLVTLGCLPDGVGTRLQLPFIHRAGLMVRANMDAPWLHRLRPRDQVSVGVPYNLVTWVVEDGVRSSPDDYLEDSLR